MGAESPTGGVPSITVTWNPHCEVRLPESVALQVTAVVPMGKMLPEAGEQITSGAWPQESEAPGASKVTFMSFLPGGRVTRTFAGQLMAGGVVSETVTWKLHNAEFLKESVAVQVTFVTPVGNVVPGGGSHTRTGRGRCRRRP